MYFYSKSIFSLVHNDTSTTPHHVHHVRAYIHTHTHARAYVCIRTRNEVAKVRIRYREYSRFAVKSEIFAERRKPCKSKKARRGRVGVAAGATNKNTARFSRNFAKGMTRRLRLRLRLWWRRTSGVDQYSRYAFARRAYEGEKGKKK